MKRFHVGSCNYQILVSVGMCYAFVEKSRVLK
jgi:hypothetical protein